MLRRWLGWVFVVLVILLCWPWTAQAQRPQRWLADPQLLTGVRTIGPNGGILAFNGVGDIDVVSSTVGWATSGAGLMRFDGRHWRLAEQFSNRTSINAVDLATETSGWAVGASVYYDGRNPLVYTPVFYRYTDGRWVLSEAPNQTDGTPASGDINDVVALANGTAWAVGYLQQDSSRPQRPRVLYFNGVNWQDRTPATWPYGLLSHLQMVSPTEGWAGGIFTDAPETPYYLGRTVLLHYKDGVWSEETLLPLDSNNRFLFDDLIMRDGNEGWATLREIAPCADGRLLHYTEGRWQLVPPAAHDSDPISLGLIPGTNRGWATLFGSCYSAGLIQPSQRMRFDNGAFTPDTDGSQFLPTSYGLLNDSVQLASAGGAFMRYSDETLPTERVIVAPPGVRYFPETGHTLSGPFQLYYETHGLNLNDPGVSARESLALFGYPLSEPFTEVNPDSGALLEVQYFERARFEHHPDNPEPYKVLLGRLGFNTLLRRDPGFQGNPPVARAPDCDGFPVTGDNLCPPFRAFWHGNGGLPVFGFPIKYADQETSPTDGNRYLTQWFERERLEYHPELQGTPYEVLLGLLGSEELRLRGYLP